MELKVKDMVNGDVFCMGILYDSLYMISNNKLISLECEEVNYDQNKEYSVTKIDIKNYRILNGDFKGKEFVQFTTPDINDQPPIYGQLADAREIFMDNVKITLKDKYETNKGFVEYYDVRVYDTIFNVVKELSDNMVHIKYNVQMPKIVIPSVLKKIKA